VHRRWQRWHDRRHGARPKLVRHHGEESVPLSWQEERRFLERDELREEEGTHAGAYVRFGIEDWMGGCVRGGEDGEGEVKTRDETALRDPA
jgi:hypothetical protein